MADSILTHCAVITVDENQPSASAIAVKHGRIMAVGDETQMMKFRTAGTRVIDLEGCTVLPGLIEVHTHPIWTAIHANEYLDISGMAPGLSKEKIWDMVSAVVRNTPKGQWVKVYGYNSLLVPDMEIPKIDFLDKIAPENPICIFAQSGHSAFFNSLAFQLAGVGPSTPNPEGGEFVKDSAGKLTGMVNETPAVEKVTKLLPRSSTSEGRVNLKRQLDSYSMNGFTTIAATGLFASFKGAYTVIEELTSMKQSPVRLAVYHREPVLRGRLEKMNRGQPGKDNYTFIGVKFWADGSPYSGTMATKDPYLDNEVTKNGLGFAEFPNYGMLNFTDQRLYESMLPYHNNGLQLSVHAHGDRALDQTLDAYEALLKNYPKNDHRYRLEHCGLITDEQLQRALNLGVTPSFFPDHIHYYGKALQNDILGKDRAARFMPVYSASKIGHKWSSHSDSPACPLGPFRAIKTIVTRAERTENEVIGSDQCTSIEDAIQAYTINPAWQIFHEDYIGSITPGKIADFTIVSENPLKMDPYELDQIKIMATYRNGQKVNWIGGRL